MSPAADLRVALNTLLGEHVYLASRATGAALAGRTAEFEAAAAVLDGNSMALSAAVGSVYGEDAGAAFLELWRSHIGFFVDYTNGVATNDEAAKTMAVENLTGYAEDFAAFLSSANPNLPAEAVQQLVIVHVNTLAPAVERQGAQDFPAAFARLREAYAHMPMIGDALAGAIAQQFPDRFPGQADSPAADLRSGLNMLLGEHAYLAAAATDAAIGGRQAEFEAAAAALDENSVALSDAIGSVYGADAGAAFLELWRSHIGFFVDYTNAVATDDEAKKTQAVTDLTGYAEDFAAFLSGANPNLPAEAVQQLVVQHVLTLAPVVDAQGAQDYLAAYTALREAFAHMQMIADPLAEAIIQQFPENFGP
jgi:hypothetical protein